MIRGNSLVKNIAKDSLNIEMNNVIFKFSREDLISQDKGQTRTVRVMMEKITMKKET